MNSSRMRRVASRHIIRPKDIFHLRWDHKTKALTGKMATNGEDPSKELLMAAGEMSDGQRNIAVQVPRGFLAVYVGPELRRFVIPTRYLSMPDFKVLMERVAEEFGYEQEGGLRIPCEEEDFQDVLTRCLARDQMMSKSKSRKKKELLLEEDSQD
uniref:Putative SAUR-like auxin-responsive protein family n=1 Tax=Davidia involucrata TaxID=16924 RepID=A0A5B7C2W3_DAVIN